MNVPLKLVALAMLVATAQLAGAAGAQAPGVPVIRPAAQSAPAATKAPIASKAPGDRNTYDDMASAPVVDNVGRQLDAAREAYDTKDAKAAAAGIRTAAGYLRQEARRAAGEAKRDLESSVAQLDMLAVSVEEGAMRDEQTMTGAFARADHALALEYRSKAAESWARREYDKAGNELKAAAHGLEGTASWIGGEAKTGTSATVADTRALGDKLAAGGAWTRDEVARGFESLGNDIDALGQKIGATGKASPFRAGA